MSSADKIYVRMCDGHLLMKTPRQRGATGRSDCGDHAGRDVTPNYCCIAAVLDTSRPYYNALQSHTVAIRTHLCSRPVMGRADPHRLRHAVASVPGGIPAMVFLIAVDVVGSRIISLQCRHRAEEVDAGVE